MYLFTANGSSALDRHPRTQLLSLSIIPTLSTDEKRKYGTHTIIINNNNNYVNIFIAPDPKALRCFTIKVLNY